MKTAPLQQPPGWLVATAQAEAYTVPGRELPEAQLELYQKLSWVQIAVSKVAEVAMTTEFEVHRINGEQVEEIANHPFELLLRRPNPLMSRAELLEATLAYHALTGNAYWWLNRPGGGAPSELWVLPPHKVQPVPDGRMYLRGYLYTPDGVQTPIPLELGDVVHFRRFHPLNSFVGLSPLESLATVVQGDLAAQRWNTKFFDKDNAKVPGILAFRDPIDDATWARMKQDIKDEYGGTKRALMMLRDVGQGVNYIQAAMSQADMQFLEGRTFTKEEIFALYAPGLSSMLAVNATEANSVSGKRTFIEYGVWPHLVRIAEKVTNDVLPLYGDNLLAAFEDIRITDKQLELQEINAYGQTHTVDEVRAKYYSDEPLGDDRGNLLVIEVGKGLTPADPNPPPPVAPVQPGPAQPEAANQAQPAADEGMDSADMEDMGGEMMQMEGSDNAANDMGQMQGRQSGQGRQKEVKALRRWLKNRPTADPLKFKRQYLSEDEVLDIAADVREADTEQPPFPMPDGELTRDDWQAIKAMVLQLPPGDDDAEELLRREIERRGEAAILRAFRQQWRNLLPDNAESMTLDELMAYINSRLLEGQISTDAIARVVQNAADMGVNVALDQLGTVGIAFDYTLVNNRARQWAADYTNTLIRGIDSTTSQGVQQAVARWYQNGEPITALRRDLEPLFGARRAKLIAQTETTRAAAEGIRQGYRESGVVTGMVWRTVNDEKICPYCGELDGKVVSLDGAFFDMLPQEMKDKLTERHRFEVPPAHPGCRCRLVAQVVEP